MDRRLFLQFPLVATALTAGAKMASAHGAAKTAAMAPAEPGPPKKGIKVDRGKDRNQEELHIMGGQFDLKVSSSDSNGQFLLYDTIRIEKGGPALHLHYSQDEFFYVISGEFLVKVGDDSFRLGAGDFAFAPRMVAHAFAKVSDGPGQMLVMFQPAGTMEDFFKQMAKMGSAIPKDQEKRLKQLWKDHGMEIVGPPLKV